MQPVSLELSVIMVSFETRDLLRESLKVLGTDPPGCSHEIIVVDNASSDGSADMVEREFPKVRLVRSGGNVGFGRGNNQALRMASGEFVLLLNPDARVGREGIDRMMACLRSQPEIGILGPRMVYPDGRLQPSVFRFHSAWREIFIALRLHRLLPKRLRGRLLLERHFGFDETLRVDWLGGSCMLVRRRVFEDIGLLTEATFHGNEDWDLCWRAAQAGWGTVFFHEVSVAHVSGASSRQYVGFPETEWFAYHNLYVILSNHRPLWSVKFYQVVLFLTFALEALRLRLFPPMDAQPRGVSALRAARCRRDLARDFMFGRVKPIRRYGEERLVRGGGEREGACGPPSG